MISAAGFPISPGRADFILQCIHSLADIKPLRFHHPGRYVPAWKTPINIEGYTTGAAWELSDCLNLEAIQLIAANLRKAVANDPDGREGMALAQYVTAMAYSNVGLGIAHSMAHTLGAVYDTPHGVACAMMLPIVMEFNAEYTGEKFKKIAEAFGVDTTGMDAAAYRKAAVDAVRQLSVDVGIPTKLEKLKEADLQFLCESAAADACAPGNPRPASLEQFEEMFRKLM